MIEKDNDSIFLNINSQNEKDIIPLSIQKLVLQRIKSSNADNLLDWETVKNNFEGID
jgi:hypothetical protein